MREAVWSKGKKVCGKVSLLFLLLTSEIWCSQHKVKEMELLFQGFVSFIFPSSLHGLSTYSVLNTVAPPGYSATTKPLIR